jgi:hypothetical protein
MNNIDLKYIPPDRNNILLEIYCDEITRVKDKDDGSVWMYLGALFVPSTKKHDLLSKLLNLRCIKYNSWHWDEIDCPNKCGYHICNNTEIHFKEVHRHKSKFEIAKRWMEFLIENNKKDLGLIYFNVLGIELSKLNLERFGEDKGRDLNIYNRFFRTLISGGVKYFFGEYESITISDIYHDKGSQEEHEYFPWYTPYRLNLTDDKIHIENTEIIFVDSDHRNYPDKDGTDFRYESQFIQFIDLILGSIHCCLHASATRKEKIELALIVKPLLERLMNNPKNKYSSYHYYRKQQIQFFPERSISEFSNKSVKQLDFENSIAEIEKLYSDNFYSRRNIKLKDHKNLSIFEFMDS